MSKVLAIAAGGALGAILRYAVSGAAYQWLGSFFPWGTLAVNLSGCFLIGLLSEIFAGLIVSQDLKTFVLVGTLGAFTTFSTFGFETANLIRDGELKYALFNVLVSNLLGLMLIFAGLFSARFLFNLFK